MPELPEVETYARALDPRLKEATVTGARLPWPKVAAVPSASSFASVISGRTIQRVWRRAKYLVFDLDEGALLIHLRMTGKLAIQDAKAEDPAHLTLALGLTGGGKGGQVEANDETDLIGNTGKESSKGMQATRELRFIDYRKFGRAWVVDNPDDVIGDLGPEPLVSSFIARTLSRRLEGRRGRLKPLLLDQRFLAGLGNIYVDESLYQARLHPLATADTLDWFQVKALHRSIRAVLTEAIDRGGTTFQSFVGPGGEAGRYLQQLRGFGRTGQACLRRGCPGSIERIKVAQRSTHFCPICQPLPD